MIAKNKRCRDEQRGIQGAAKMDNILRQLWNFLKENEKDMLISSSGSIPSGNNETVRAGQSYLYNKRGMESEVIEVRFDKNIWGSHLNRALNLAIKRYPYLNTRLIERDGDFYIVQNTAAPVARKTQNLAKLGGISCSYHLIDITYWESSVFVSFHHALCDGRGIKPFVETLIYYYCCFRYNNTDKIEGIRLADDDLLEGETDDPFTKTYDYDESKKFIEIPREAFRLEENKAGETVYSRRYYRYEIKLDHDNFMTVCREYNATPAIMVALATSKAIADIYPDYDKPINANIATDMRRALGAENTYKNCVLSMILPYDRQFASLPLKEQATKYRELLNAQRDADYCRFQANAMIKLFDKLDSISGYADKQKIMTFFEDMALDTYVISYLGQFAPGSNAQHVDSIHLYNSGTTGLGITMTATDVCFTINFKQSFESDRYVKAFAAQLRRLGISCEPGNGIEFETPTDNLLKRR